MKNLENILWGAGALIVTAAAVAALFEIIKTNPLI